MIVPVILSGGTGSRLWPVSREIHPKPFIRMDDGMSLLQKTANRICAVPGITRLLTITNREHYFKTRDDYEELPALAKIELDYILEPAGRNTAPAIAVAAARLLELLGGDVIMLVMPADHLIEDQSSFAARVQVAARQARQGALVTLGIRPTRPDTGFGYIQKGESLGSTADNLFRVSEFVEKPDAGRATRFLSSGDYLWNAGIFCFSAQTLLDELRQHDVELYESVMYAWQKTNTANEPVELDADAFSQVASRSIDYAVMEKSDNVLVAECDFGWNDIGTWRSFSEAGQPDDNGNCASDNAVVINSRNTTVRAEDRIVAAVGIEDIIIIDTADAVLVVDRNHVQDVRHVVDHLKSINHESYRLHRTVHRPWGTYTVLEEGPRYKIKRIVLKPHASISLQYHNKRSEHWVVIEGMAEVDDGENSRIINANESTYIPVGQPHRLSNAGDSDLAIIEVQCGDYVGEDDIVRLKDIYGRI
jgi:mannose-1-phosphate guanylyltransferase/mannose-6-phosphate isomerase